MIVECKVNATTIIKVDAETVKEAFEQLARASEIFGINSCGACGAKFVRHIVRNVDDYTFYELKCLNQDCRARLAFGQSKSPKGGLFPSRKDKDGNWKKNDGWEIWKKPFSQTTCEPTLEDGPEDPF